MVTQERAGGRPWWPVTPGSQDSQFAVDDKGRGHAPFSVGDLHSGTLIGSAVLCHYGFVFRGPHRLRMETLSDNDAMLCSAERNGIVCEGVPRSAAWVMGEFVDEVLLGILVEEWKPCPKNGTGA